MEQDVNTDENQVVQQEVQPETEVAEVATEGEAESTESEPKEEAVKLSPAEYRHFKKWQASQKQPAQKVDTQPQIAPQLNVEEAVLLANGMPEELLSELKAVAAVRKTSLIKAQNDPIFVAVKEKLEKEKKKREASLGASRGAGSVKASKTVSSPGLSREEHMKLVRESFS